MKANNIVRKTISIMLTIALMLSIIPLAARATDFKNDDEITYNEAVGYGKQGEYDGVYWQTNALIHGINRGIFNGVSNVDFTKAANREEIAQYAFNALGVDNDMDQTIPFVFIIGSWNRTPDGYNVDVIVNGERSTVLVNEAGKNDLVELSGKMLSELRIDTNGVILNNLTSAILTMDTFDILHNIGGVLLLDYKRAGDIADDTPIYVIIAPPSGEQNATVMVNTGSDYIYSAEFTDAKICLIDEYGDKIHSTSEEIAAVYIITSAEPYISYPTGINVTGTIRSYNPNNPITITLKQDNQIKYTTSIEASTGYGLKEQPFEFERVVPGIYDLVIDKAAHTQFVVRNIRVNTNKGDLTLDRNPEVRLMALRCGDINGDGLINDGDLTVLWMLSNYNRDAENATNPLCDLNGDGMINDGDLTILWKMENYNKGEVLIDPTVKLALVLSFGSYSELRDGKIVTNYTADIVDLDGKVVTVLTTEAMYNSRANYQGKVCLFAISADEYIFTTPSGSVIEYKIDSGVTQIQNGSAVLPGATTVTYAGTATKFVIVNYRNGIPDGTVTVYNGTKNVPNFDTLTAGKTFAVSYNHFADYADAVAEIVYIYENVYDYNVFHNIFVIGTWTQISTSRYEVVVIIDGELYAVVVNGVGKNNLSGLSGKFLSELIVSNNGEIMNNLAAATLKPDDFSSICNYGGFLLINGSATYPGFYSVNDDTPVYVMTVPSTGVHNTTAEVSIAADYKDITYFDNAQIYIVGNDGNQVGGSPDEIAAIYIISGLKT